LELSAEALEALRREGESAEVVEGEEDEQVEETGDCRRGGRTGGHEVGDVADGALLVRSASWSLYEERTGAKDEAERLNQDH